MAETLPDGWTAADTTTTSVSNERAFSGSQSLKIEAPGGGYNQNYLQRDLPAELQETMHGRMMIRLNSDNANSGDFTFIQATGNPQAASGAPANTAVMYRGRLDGGDDHFFANYDTWLDEDGVAGTDWHTDCYDHPETPTPAEYLIPKDEWACVQWHFDSDTNSMTFWLNEMELTQINVTNTGEGCEGTEQDGVWYAPETFTRLGLGIEQYHNDAGARTMYIDDIALGSQMISCPGNMVADNPGTEEPVTEEPGTDEPGSEGPDSVNGQMLFESAELGCSGCHFNLTTVANWSETVGDQAALATEIHNTMPVGADRSPAMCEDDCAEDIAAYVLSLSDEQQ